MTARAAGRQPPARAPSASRAWASARVLPRVSSNLLSGLIETVAAPPFNGTADLPKIASDLQMEIDELFPVAETLQMMRFAEVEGGDIKLTDPRPWPLPTPTLDERKRIFARHLLDLRAAGRAHPPRARRARLARRAQEPLHRRARGLHGRGRRRADAARRSISLARYAEVFAYDDESARFSLENPA